MEWMHSVDLIRRFEPDFLVPCHTKPIFGAQNIQEITIAYRDAIQYVHDQTVRNMNKGLMPDDITQLVKLPPQLAQHPYLQEFYGKVEWSVKNIFNGYLGFFDGNSTTLQPLNPTEKAQKMAELVGGQDILKQKCQKAFEAKQYEWALELTDYLLRLQPQDTEGVRIKVASLEALGEAESNPNARHYYFTTMATNLVPAKSANVDKIKVFKFDDTKEVFSLHFRYIFATASAKFSL